MVNQLGVPVSTGSVFPCVLAPLIRAILSSPVASEYGAERKMDLGPQTPLTTLPPFNLCQ